MTETEVRTGGLGEAKEPSSSLFYMNSLQITEMYDELEDVH